MSSNSSDANLILSLNFISAQINRYLSIAILLFGTVGNILNCLVLSQKSLRKNPCSWLFLASSITSLITLISGVAVRLMAGWSADLTDTVPALCKIRIFVLFDSRTVASWLIMLATVDIWFSSSIDANRRHMSTLKNAQLGALLIVLLSSLVYAQIFYCYEANLTNAPLKCYGKTIWCRLLIDFTFTIVSILIPSLFMFIFGFMTILNIRYSALRRIQPMNTSLTQWDKIVNTDFSGIFTIEGFHNSKNDVIYAEEPSEIPADLREASIVKYPSGVMFWGAITTKGLISQDGPINFTQWLRDQCPLDKRKRMYMTGDLYAKFLREEAISTINEVVENLNEVIFQDDQDSKHRTKTAMDVVNDFFEEIIEPNDGDAKFADVWPIENIWGIMEEKTRGKTFENMDSLVDFINSEWRKITPEQCKAMIDNIPKRLAKVIQFNGNQVYEH
ncbi:unnamed protein product [Rotaria sordida]|uniref:G-protein coupled receptors family 1 profile domain-containing protein n=2 Tax=Rotaria sordida TaxID=392033 RepID=A0A815DXW3_9BILA|nr:unnamed protein product [Rotaria sordida]